MGPVGSRGSPVSTLFLFFLKISDMYIFFSLNADQSSSENILGLEAMNEFRLFN